MILVSSGICLCPICWSQVLSREWRCSRSSAGRRCSDYIWMINNLIANYGASYIRDLTVVYFDYGALYIYPMQLRIFNATNLWHTPLVPGERYSCDVRITLTSQWARWRLKSPASALFIQLFIQVQIKENIKAPRYWALCGEFTGDRWILRTKGQ